LCCRKRVAALCLMLQLADYRDDDFDDNDDDDDDDFDDD
jgi:hypothetical protein